MSCGVGCRLSSDLLLRWPWCWPVAIDLIWHLTRELPCAACAALKRKKKTPTSTTIPSYSSLSLFFHMSWITFQHNLCSTYFFFLKVPPWHMEVPSRSCSCQPTPQLTATPDILTRWTRPGVKPKSSWILVRFLTTEPRHELIPISFYPWSISNHFIPYFQMVIQKKLH